MEKKKMSLPVQIVLALILGIVVGLIFYFIGKPEITTNYFKPFGTIFVNLLKFIVVPVVLLSMIDGIISKLESYRDEELREKTEGDHNAMMKLVRKYWHCG